MPQDKHPLQAPPAGFWRKFFAWLYDACIVFGISATAMAIAMAVVALFAAEQQAQDPQLITRSPFTFIYIVAVNLAYFAGSWRKSGQTVGMAAWRLKLVSTAGDKPSWRAILIRAATALGGLGILLTPFNRGKLGWHDIAAGTRVIQLPKKKKAGRKAAGPQRENSTND